MCEGASVRPHLRALVFHRFAICQLLVLGQSKMSRVFKSSCFFNIFADVHWKPVPWKGWTEFWCCPRLKTWVAMWELCLNVPAENQIFFPASLLSVPWVTAVPAPKSHWPTFLYSVGCCCREDNTCTFLEGLFSAVVQRLVSPCFCSPAGCSVRPKQAFCPEVGQLCVPARWQCSTCDRCRNGGLWSHPTP